MINLTAAKLLTAKLLLFVALTLGPKEMPHSILITGPSVGYAWTKGTGDWNLKEKDLPTHDWPANGLDISREDLVDIGKENIQAVHAIARHDWDKNPVLYLDNGDRVEKQGNKVFYTVRTGEANQQVFTILYIENDMPL